MSKTELERLFARGRLTRRQFVSGLAALGLTARGIETLAGSDSVPAEAASPPARYLVLIVIDAFRADYLQLAPTPVISSLARTGASYDHAWVGHVESYTPTGHAALSTGNFPKHNGVLGFEWRNANTGQEVLDGWAQGVIAGALDRDLRASGVGSIPLAMKGHDPHATVVAISSEKVYAAGAIGGWAADYILYYQRAGSRLVPSAIPGHVPPSGFLDQPSLQQKWPLSHVTDWDYLSAAMALASIQAFKPRVLMVNFPGTDYYGHPYGGPASPALFKQLVAGVDRNIGRIVQAYKKAGIFNETLFVITGDHGMVPNVHSIDGSITKKTVHQAGGNYYFHTGGTAAYVYLHNQGAAPAVSQAMSRLPNVVAAYSLETSAGKHYYTAAPGTQIDSALDAAYRYLMGTFLGPTAPDVVTAFRENTIGIAHPEAHGDHGGMNWGAQHVPLVLSGPGVASGTVSSFPARLADVTPTILRLLGLPPFPMDGLVLADALNAATAQEVALQTAAQPSLKAYQEALMAKSLDNTEEDVKQHLLPPKPLKPQP